VGGAAGAGAGTAAGAALPPQQGRGMAAENVPEEPQADGAAVATPAPAEAAPPHRPPKPPAPAERFQEGLEQKEQGNQAYGQGDYAAAIESWCMARGTLKHILERGLFDGDEEKLAEVRSALLSVHLNLAQGSLRSGEFHQAVQHCDRALELDRKSAKALYRKAAGQRMGSLYPEARQTLEALLELEPSNAGARQMLLEVEHQERQAARSGRRAAMRMMAGMEHDPRVKQSAGESASHWAHALLACRWCRRRKRDD